MNEPARKPRKPLRRTAWSMLLGGLGVTAVMLGVGTYLVNVAGESAGPDQAATWPAGTDIAVFDPAVFPPPRSLPGRSRKYTGIDCTVTTQGGRPMPVWLRWEVRNQPDFVGPATITCPYPVTVLTGPAITIANTTRGTLLGLPLISAFLGILFFFPRFASLLSSLSYKKDNDRFI